LARTVVVTGANGFIGVPLCALLVRGGADVTAVVRRESAAFADLTTDPTTRGRLRQVVVGDLGAAINWSAALAGAEAVVHLAGRVHVPGVGAPADRERFREINVDATLRLAEAAARARVRRMVFVSSAKAGDDDASDPYSRSKAEAERLLGEASRNLGFECVIVRPPLVYGPRVRANFLRLMRLVDFGVPLPLASVANRRSLLFVGNLADALVTCTGHPRAVGHTFSVSDGEDVSTPELVRRIARALDRPARLFPFPVALLRLAGVLAGQKQAIDRLTGDLAIDSTPIRTALDWHPPFSMELGLAETAAWYRTPRVHGGGPGSRKR
jgi:nucleoside-diphosphate-sugar epimerase